MRGKRSPPSKRTEYAVCSIDTAHSQISVVVIGCRCCWRDRARAPTPFRYGSPFTMIHTHTHTATDTCTSTCAVAIVVYRSWTLLIEFHRLLIRLSHSNYVPSVWFDFAQQYLLSADTDSNVVLVAIESGLKRSGISCTHISIREQCSIHSVGELLILTDYYFLRSNHRRK